MGPRCLRRRRACSGGVPGARHTTEVSHRSGDSLSVPTDAAGDSGVLGWGKERSSDCRRGGREGCRVLRLGLCLRL